MKAFVIDASISANWLFDDENDDQADSALSALETRTGLIPQIWHYEMRNILLVAHRRERVTHEGMIERVDALVNLPLETDTNPDLDHAFALAETHRLSFYDALYSELAVRRDAGLITLDRRLMAAAEAEGIETGVPNA